MIRLTEEGQLDELWQLSFQRPVLLFKHSLACGASHAARSHVAALLRDHAPASACEFRLVEVQRARAVSDAIARRSGVRHETPQLIVLRNGVVRWHDSHGGLHPRALTAAVDALD